jgi:tetratricopeptide (TPR) repeat protein
MTETIALFEVRLTDAQMPGEKIAALNALAWQLRGTDPHRVLSLGEEAARMARTDKDDSALAAALCLVGVGMCLLSRHQEAREALADSLPLSRRLGDLTTEARCLHYIGAVHYLLSEHTEAIENVMASLQIREELEDWEGLGVGFNMLGNIQFALCDYGQALEWYQCGLEARERAGDQQGVAASLGNLGNVYSERGDFAEAVGFHERALDQAVRIGSTALEISGLCSLGGSYVDLGRYEEGIAVCRRSVTLGRTLDDWGKVGVTLTSMGYALGKTRRRQEALDCYAEALKISRAAQNRKVAAHSLFSIGEIFLDQGRLDEARAHLVQAFTLAQRLYRKSIGRLKSRQQGHQTCLRRFRGRVYEGRLCAFAAAVLTAPAYFLYSFSGHRRTTNGVSGSPGAV